eukprot:gene12305-12392_t
MEQASPKSPESSVPRMIKSGEYLIPSRASISDILRKLRAGDIVRHKITVPEGASAKQVRELLTKADVLTGDTPEVAEGSVLPETYDVTRGESRSAVALRMTAAMDKVLAQYWAKRKPDLPIHSPEEAVILASIVEKETAKESDRPRVAAVYINRLRIGMKLDADPTVIYGVTGGLPLGRGIRASELAADTPYNTYVHAGLPPTAIANPGRASIAAVLDPPQTNELYFVADGTGGAAFAATLAEHEQNVARWREIERHVRATSRRQEALRMALFGMTGFARADGALGRWTWAVEARSVNGRTLEARFRGPNGFEGLERVARDGAQARFGRGQIQISLQARREETTGALRVNTALLDELIVVCDRYRTRAGLGEPRLDGLLAVRGVVETAEETETPEARAELEAAMGQTVIQALDRLKEARAGEGAALAPVLSGQVDRIAELVAQAETEAAAQIVAIRERFTRRMAELIPDPKPLEERIAFVAGLMAEEA